MNKIRQCPCNGKCRNCTGCHLLQNPDLEESSSCMECQYKESLYFCLTCGHIACGSRNKGHALVHLKEIKHVWMLALDNFYVWNNDGMNGMPHKLKELEPQLRVSGKADLNCKCPVCRYHQIPRLSKVTTCMSCRETENLWICLTCRYIGCGRLQNGHGLHHYQRTEHSRVMQLKTFRIWDYKEDKYVHRLYDTGYANDCRSIVGNDEIQMSEQDEDVKRLEEERLSFGDGNNEIQASEQDDDFESRMKHLEDERISFSTLKEINLQMISIEQRLITLSEEKKMFEEKLREHDDKLNELLNQFKQRQDILPTFTDRNHNIKNENGSTENISDQLSQNISTNSINIGNKPMMTLTVSENFKPSEWIHLCLLVLLFLYNFLYLFILATA